MTLWMAMGLAAGAFCIARGAVDLRRRRYIWGVAGIAIGCALLLTPIQSSAVKFDVPAPSRR